MRPGLLNPFLEAPKWRRDLQRAARVATTAIDTMPGVRRKRRPGVPEHQVSDSWQPLGLPGTDTLPCRCPKVGAEEFQSYRYLFQLYVYNCMYIIAFGCMWQSHALIWNRTCRSVFESFLHACYRACERKGNSCNYVDAAFTHVRLQLSRQPNSILLYF